MAQSFGPKRNIALGLVTAFLCLLAIELILNVLTLTGILPVNDVLSPSFYKSRLQRAENHFDAHGSPIRVNGYRVYTNRDLSGPPIYFDKKGYRSADASRFNSPNYKVGVFGDSYTDGLQVSDDETYPRILERLIEAEKGNYLDVYNFGTGGTGTYHQFLRYLTVSEDVDLDLALLALVPQNDILNNYRPLGKDFELVGSPYYLDATAAGSKASPDLLKVRMTRFAKRGFEMTVGSTFIGRAIYFGPSVFKHRILGAGMAEGWFPREERASWLGVYGSPDGHWEQAWKVTEEIILKFASEAGQRGDQFAMVIVADSLQIHNLLRAGMFSEEYDFSYPNRRLMEFCKDHKLNCYDSLPFFTETATNLNLSPPFFSWKYDGHYASIGHRTMAQYLHKALKNEWTLVELKHE